MAARRLIAALIALLVLSTVAAVLVPDPDVSPRRTASTSTERRTTTTARAPRPRGRSVHATLDARTRKAPTIELRVGDHLTLRVLSRAPDQVELRRLGALEAVDRFAPAVFDLIATQPGDYPVRLIQAKRTVGTLRVRRAG
jgi:hypothetical protein